MVQRLYPEDFFGEPNSSLLIFGLVVLGVVACVSIVAIVKWGK